MSLSYYVKDPNKGYITNNLLLPKAHINTRAVQQALQFYIGEETIEEGGEILLSRPKMVELWSETKNHLVVPRSFISPRQRREFDFEWVDLRPSFPPIDVPNTIVPRSTAQQEALEAIHRHRGGTLNLACIAGDTEINFNRGGKGFKMPIAKAYKHWLGVGRYSWGRSIPTRVRAKKGDKIGLHEIEAILYRGKRQTLTLTLEDGKKIRLTSDHKVLTTKGWMSIDDGLSPGNLVIVDGEKTKCDRQPKLGYGVPTPVVVKSVGKGKMEDVYDIVCRDPHRNFVANGLVVHNCGRGKTVIALKYWAERKMPAIVVVNNGGLLYQWLDEIVRHVGPNTKVGRIDGTSCTWEGCDIVLAMVHSLANKRYEWSKEFRSRFGLIIFDEVHHMSAPHFVQAADLFYGERLGLTATASRTDGLEAVYQYHIGSVFYTDLTQDLIPETTFYQMDWIPSDEQLRKMCDRTGSPHHRKTCGVLGGIKPRNDFILENIRRDIAAGRQVLALTHSVKHTRLLYKRFGSPAAGFINGEDVPAAERPGILQSCNPVFGTFDLAREALNKPTLDTLHVCTPFGNSNDLQQAWGRIQREKEGKQSPKVFVYEDIHVPQSVSQCNSLRKYLRALNYPAKKEKIKS